MYGYERHRARCAGGVKQERPAKVSWYAAGGILGAVIASTCCLGPLLLLGLGVSGAWIGSLTTLEPYKYYFSALAIICIGIGLRLIYGKAKPACIDGYCARPGASIFVKTTLWLALGLVLLAVTVNIWAPWLY